MTHGPPSRGNKHFEPVLREKSLISTSFLGLLFTQFLGATNDNILRWLVIGIGKDYASVDVNLLLGLGMGVFPELFLTHLIAKERLSESYLVRLCEGVRASDYLLHYKWFGVVPASTVSVRSALSILKAVLLRRGIDRRMYLANVRAAVRARQVIAEQQRDGR